MPGQVGAKSDVPPARPLEELDDGLSLAGADLDRAETIRSQPGGGIRSDALVVKESRGWSKEGLRRFVVPNVWHQTSPVGLGDVGRVGY